MEHRDIQLPAEQQWAGGMNPVHVEAAFILLEVAGPERIAVAIERGQVAAAIIEVDIFPIGDGRGGAEVVPVVGSRANRDIFGPEDLAIGLVHADGDKLLGVLVPSGQKDAISEYDRRAGARAGHRGRPGKVGFHIQRLGQLGLLRWTRQNAPCAIAASFRHDRQRRTTSSRPSRYIDA